MRNKNRGAFKDKKKWLISYQELMQEVEDETDRAGFWKDKALGLSSVQWSLAKAKSANGKTMPEYVIEFLEIADHCSKIAKEADIRKTEILEAINQVDDSECRQVLKMFYIGRKSFLQIAESMHYSVDWVKRAHNRALQKLKVPEEYTQIHS